jgi:excinuclease ABC subunit B
MKEAIGETERRRAKQIEFNITHNIKPKSIVKPIPHELEAGEVEAAIPKSMGKKQKEEMVSILEEEMKAAAERLDFEQAIALRDKIRALRK